MIAEILASFAKNIIGEVSRWVQQRFKSKQPIEFSVEHFVEDQWSVVFPGKPESLVKIEGKRMRGHNLHACLMKLGAVDQGETRVRLRLRARTQDPVLLTQITACAAKSAPIVGTKITHPTAGVSDTTLLMVDFDTDGVLLPVWGAVEESFELRPVGERPFFARKQISLSQSSYEDLIIVGRTNRYSVNWSLKLDYEVSGRQGSMQIDNHGSPFQTTGEPLEGYMADLLWAWYDGHKLLPNDLSGTNQL
jgi:hypothetical protein